MRENIKKELSEEDRIASVREFAISIEVNPNTVVRTYSYLEEKEIIYKQRGIGYFITKDAYKKVLKLKKESFLKKEAPELFKTMGLLDIEFNELKKLYEKK